MIGVAGRVLLAAACRSRRGGVIINEHTLSAAETRRHVEVLGRSFDFIHHDELLPRLLRPRGRPFCLLTFDDGKRSNYSEAAPELERLGVPAVFYLVTRFLRGEQPLWFDAYTALRRVVGDAPYGLELETVKQLPHEMRAERLQRAMDRHGVVIDADDHVRPMSWDEARALADRGFTIGAHGVQHRIMTREPLDVALADIRDSIAEVTAELGDPCTTFAFPNGNYTARLARCAIDAGVRTVMTTEPIWATERARAWRLPRVQLFGSSSPEQIELKLALAATERVLRNPDGTGRLYRRIGRAERRGAAAGDGAPTT